MKEATENPQPWSNVRYLPPDLERKFIDAKTMDALQVTCSKLSDDCAGAIILDEDYLRTRSN